MIEILLGLYILLHHFLNLENILFFNLTSSWNSGTQAKFWICYSIWEKPFSVSKFIFEKYKKEYYLLKEKNINDKVAMTILMIYYLKNEYFELLTELVMIIKKGEIYIKKEINIIYEEIIEKIK